MSTTLLALACAALLGAPQDSVTLKDGKVLEGRVIFDGTKVLVLRQKRKEQRIDVSEVAEVHSLERSLAKIVTRDIAADDSAGLAGAARECTEAGLAPEARIFWLRLLLHEPENAEAAEGLDAKRYRDKDWKIKFARKERRLSELRELQPKWKEAVQISTTHFELQSDLPLAEVLELALALERFYHRFYSVLADPLELRVFDPKTLPDVRIYGTAKSWQAPPVEGDKVWFGAAENCLHVRADEKLEPRTVVAELSRQMLFSALRRSLGPTEQIPAWVASGFDQFFAIAAPSERGGEWAELGEPYTEWFRIAADSKFDLKRVIRSSHNDFTRDVNRVELTACAYSLVHYLVRGEEGSMRSGFLLYLTEGAKGKTSVAALAKAVGIDAKTLEQGWRAYSKRLGGG